MLSDTVGLNESELYSHYTENGRRAGDAANFPHGYENKNGGVVDDGRDGR